MDLRGEIKAMATLLLFTVIMFVTMTISGVIGFAGNVIALPLLSQFLDLQTAVAVLALSSFVQTVVQAVQNRRLINWRELLIILVFTFIGMPVGIFSLRYLPETALKLLLGLFILVVSTGPFIAQFVRQSGAATPQPKPWDWLYLIGGGFFSGAFASGGPLVVIYCTRHLPDKDLFRGTMFANGCFAMGVVALEHFWQRQYTADTLLLTAVALVVMLAAVRVSGWIARRVDARKFNVLVNLALMLAGIMLLVQAVL